MSKSEAISWYRIQEMFRFQAFHMYGIIGSALIFGIAIIDFIKRKKLYNLEKEPIIFEKKEKQYKRY